ncbi:MAG: hypothetical protein ACREBJ_05675 [Nitrosotalea sp.]
MIKKKLLVPGDLLFFKPKSVLDISAWLIAWAQNVVGKNPLQGKTKLGYCHVALVDEDTDYILEARWPKTRRWKIDWTKLDKNYHTEQWRMKNVTRAEIDEALSWAHDHLGEWYDLGLFLWGMIKVKNTEVCSTFVANAWAAAGRYFKEFKQIGEYRFQSPDELVGNTNLIKQVFQFGKHNGVK